MESFRKAREWSGSHFRRLWNHNVVPHLIWWGWIPLVLLVQRLLLVVVFEGKDWTQTTDQYLMANFWSRGGWLWIYLCVGFAGSMFIHFFNYEREEKSNWGETKTVTKFRRSGSGKWIAVTLAFLIMATAAQAFCVSWDNDKDFARYYNQSTTFYIPSLDDVPNSLQALTKSAQRGDGTHCDLVGAADVPSCIKQGALPDTGWDARVSSLDGAEFALKRTSADTQGVSLNSDTLVYLNAWKNEPARWSGILDGKGINVHMGGVTEWEGQGKPIQCEFKKEYAIDRAFGGDRSNSLKNLLAEKYPSLRFNMFDAWGYCDGDEPIVVIPMKKQVYFKNRTVDTAGGIVIVRGDNGHTKLSYKASVKPGEYPGPVYPATLVNTQRDEVKWAAGRERNERDKFGYEPGKSIAQAGNVSEYLLRNKKTGRLEWVTPLTLRGSSSELFVAYAITPADEVNSDDLNQLKVYVLADDDPRRINIDNLESDARNYLANNAGTFKSNGGKLVEFTPVDGDRWRAFAEMNGRVVYRLDISASRKIKPELVSLDSQSTTVGEDKGQCGEAVGTLTPAQLTGCMQQFVNELADRQKTGNSD